MNGWIGVDLDGTLAHYDGWQADGGIGPPVPLMLERVKLWLGANINVRIMTARVSGAPESAEAQRKIIDEWCLVNIGRLLTITCSKDFAMIEQWDDRAIQVVSNTGERADGVE